MIQKLFLDKIITILLVITTSFAQKYSLIIKVGEGTGIGIKRDFSNFNLRFLYQHQYIFLKDQSLLAHKFQIYVAKASFFNREQSLSIDLGKEFGSVFVFYTMFGAQLRYRPSIYFREFNKQWRRGTRVAIAPGLTLGVQYKLNKIIPFVEASNYFEIFGAFISKTSVNSTRFLWIYPQIGIGIIIKPFTE